MGFRSPKREISFAQYSECQRAKRQAEIEALNSRQLADTRLKEIRRLQEQVEDLRRGPQDLLDMD